VIFLEATALEASRDPFADDRGFEL